MKIVRPRMMRTDDGMNFLQFRSNLGTMIAMQSPEYYDKGAELYAVVLNGKVEHGYFTPFGVYMTLNRELVFKKMFEFLEARKEVKTDVSAGSIC